MGWGGRGLKTEVTEIIHALNVDSRAYLSSASILDLKAHSDMILDLWSLYLCGSHFYINLERMVIKVGGLGTSLVV